MVRHTVALPAAAIASSGSRAVCSTASAWLTCSRQARSTLSPADGSLPSALLLSAAPASTRAMRSTSGRLDSNMGLSSVARSTRSARFGFGGWQPRDLAGGMDQLDRKHGDDRAVMLDADLGERL